LLYTGQRRGDVIRMGPQHVNNGAIELRQQKTKTCLAIPIHPALAEIMSATPTNHLAFLTTDKGTPFTSASSAKRQASPMVCRRTVYGRRRLGV
jgi:integrase